MELKKHPDFEQPRNTLFCEFYIYEKLLEMTEELCAYVKGEPINFKIVPSMFCHPNIAYYFDCNGNLGCILDLTVEG